MSLFGKWCYNESNSQEDIIAETVIIKDPDILGGIPVFRGSRVPVQNLIDYLATGETIDSFLDDFPTVNREQVIQFLEYAGAATAHENSGWWMPPV